MSTKRRLVVAKGPNLNLLGSPQPAMYGTNTLAETQAMVDARAAELGWSVSFFQTNHEGELIDRLQREGPGALGIVINPAAFTHYSYALMDCLLARPPPAGEDHLS